MIVVLNKKIIVALLSLCVCSQQAMSTTTTQEPKPSSSITVPIKKGNLTFYNLLKACPDITNVFPSKFVHKSIPGMVIEIVDNHKNVQKYQIRYFSYEDTTEDNKFKNITFEKYIQDNEKLSQMTSTVTTPLGIHLESFDFRHVNLSDGVYFSLAVRPLNEEDFAMLNQ